MSVFIAPVVSTATSLLTQSSRIRATKLQSDFSYAQSRNLPQDQDYLAYAQAHGSNVTRQEYDALRGQLENGSNGTPKVSQAEQVASGLFAVSGGSPNAPWMRGAIAQPGAPMVFAPAGSSAQMPAGPGAPGAPGAMPDWVLPVGIAAVGLVVVSTMMRGRGK